VTEHARCPFCQSDKVSPQGYIKLSTGQGFTITCGDCNAEGPSAPTEAEAWAAWDARPNLLSPEADRRERAAVKPPVPGWLAYIVSRDSAIRHRAEFPASAYDYDRGYLRALEMVIAREFDASAKEQPTPS
jgi:hypothetical protein